MKFEWTRRAFQFDGPARAADIDRLEHDMGRPLPPAYRAFLLKTNGGSLRPYVFDLAIPEPGFAETFHALDYLFDWDAVLEQSQLGVPRTQRTVPPDRLAIGITVSDLVLMLCIADARFGAIDAWVRDIQNVWGEGENITVVPCAPSFEAFLAKLRADRGDETYHSEWAGMDADGEVAKQIELP